MVVRARGVDEAAVRVDHHAAVGRVGGLGPDVATVAGGGVVTGERAAEGRVFPGFQGVVHRDGEVVDGGDLDGHDGGVGAAMAVADGVGDHRRAMEVGGRDEVQGAIRIDGDGALLGRDGGGGDGEGVVLRVGVVGQHRNAPQRCVFGGDEDAVVHGDGGIVLAIDGDGQGCACGVAVLVGDGVGEHLGQGVAGAHGRHRGVGVVEAVGVAAVGGKREAAVGAGQGGAEGARGGAEAHVADRARNDVGAQSVGGVTGGARRKDVAAGGGGGGGEALVHAVGVGVGAGLVIDDADGQGAAGAAAAGVVDLQGEDVGALVDARGGLIGAQGVGVVEGAGGGDAAHRRVHGEAGQGELALAGGDGDGRGAQGVDLRQGHQGAVDAEAVEAVIGAQGDAAGAGFAGVGHGGEACLEYGGLARCSAVAIHGGDRRAAVGDAVDGDGELGDVAEGARIGQGVAEDFGEGVTGLEGVHHRVGVVEGVAVAAVGADAQAAVEAGDDGAVGAGGACCDGAHHAAAGFGAGADAGDAQLGVGVVQVAVLPGGAGLDVAGHRHAALGDAVHVIHCHRGVGDGDHVEGGGEGVGELGAVAGGVAVGIPHLPADGALRGGRVLAGVAVADGFEGAEYVGQVGGGTAEGQGAGAGVVALGPAGRQAAGGQGVAAAQAGADLHGGRHHLGVVHVAEGPARGFEEQGGVVLGEGPGRARATQGRRIVDRHDVDQPRGRAGAGAGAAGAAVAEAVGDGAAAVGGGVVVVRVFAGAQVGEAAQDALVIGGGVRAGQGEDAGGGVVAGSDAGAGGVHGEHVAREEAAGEADAAAAHLGVVGITQGDGVVDAEGRVVFGVDLGTAGGQHGLVHNLVDVDEDVAAARQLAAAALVLPAARGAAAGGVGVLVVDGVGEGDGGGRGVAAVAVGNGLQHAVRNGGGGAAVEGDGEGAAGVGEAAHHRAAVADVGAAEVDAGGAAAGDAEDVIGVGAAVALDAQHGTAPARVDVQFRVHQGGVGVHHDGGAAFAVGVGRRGVEAGDAGGFVLVGGDQGKGVGGGGGAADAGGQLRAAVVAIIHGHAEGDGAIDVGVGGHVADGGQCGQQVGPVAGENQVAGAAGDAEADGGADLDGAVVGCAQLGVEGDGVVVDTHLEARGRVADVGRVVEADGVARADELEAAIGDELGPAGHAQGRRVVDRADGDGDGGAVAARAAAVDAGVAAVVHREAQGVVAVVVGGALVVEVAQGGVEVGGGAAQGDGAGSDGAGRDAEAGRGARAAAAEIDVAAGAGRQGDGVGGAGEGVRVGKRQAGDLAADVLIDGLVRRRVGDDGRVVGVGRGNGKDHAGHVVGGVDGGAVDIGGTAVGAGGEGARGVPQAVIHGDLDLQVGQVRVGAVGGGAQLVEGGLHVGQAALEDDGVVACCVGDDDAGGQGAAEAQHARGEGGVGSGEEFGRDLHEVLFAGADAAGYVQIGQGDGRQGHRGDGRIDHQARAGGGDGGLVVGRVQLDVVAGRGGRAALGHRAAVIGDEVAVADHVVEEVGRGLAAVMPVGDAPAVQVGLGEYRADGEDGAAQQQAAVGGGGGDPVLALFGAVVGVAVYQVGDVVGGQGGGACAGDAIGVGVSQGAADGGRGAFGDGPGLAADQLGLVLVLVRIVDGREGDRDDQLGAGAGVIGGRGGARGDALVVDRDEPEAVGEVLAAVVGVDQLAGGELGCRHVVAHADGHAVEGEAAVGDVAGDLEAQGVVDGVAGFVVGGRVVGVGEDDVGRRDGDAAALGPEDAAAVGGGGRVVLGRDGEGEIADGGFGGAVGDRVGEDVVEVFAAGMDEGDVPGIYVCLGEAVEVRQGRAVEADAAAGGQGQDAVSQLGGYGVRVGGGELGVVEGDGLPFEQRRCVAAAGVGHVIDRRGRGHGVAVDAGALHVDAEGVDRQGVGAGHVDAAIPGGGVDAAIAVLDGEADAVGAWRGGEGDVDQSSVGDVLLGEGGARHQPGAAEAEVAFGRIRDGGERVGEAAVRGVGVGHLEHRRGDGQAGAGAGESLGDVGGEHRVVVVADDPDLDGGVLGQGDAGAAATVGDAHVEAVGRAGGLAAIVAVGELAQVGHDEGAACAGAGDRYAIVFERAMGGQAGDAVAEDGVVRVAARDGAAGRGHRRHQVGVGGEADVLLAFEDGDRAGHAGRLVDRGDGHGDHLVGQQATGAVIDGDEEGVVGGCQHLVAIVGIAELGDLADGEGGADGQLVAGQLEHTLTRQAGDFDDDLVLGVVHVRQAQVDLGEAHRTHVGGGAEAGRAAFGYAQGGAAREHRDVVGRGDGQVDRAVRRGAAVVGRDGEIGGATGFRQTTEIHAVDGGVDVAQGAAEADRARAVAGETDKPGGAGEGQGAGGGTEGDGLVVAVAIGKGDAADGDVAVFAAAAGGADAVGDGRGRQQAV